MNTTSGMEGRGSNNSRNGTTNSTVQTNAGPVDLDKLRDRNGEFGSVVMPKGTRRLSEFHDMVFSFYAKGMTTRDISPIASASRPPLAATCSRRMKDRG